MVINMRLKGSSMKMFLIFLCAVNYGVIGSKDEDMMLHKQLNILNKPPIKTIHTEWGDIVDCIDISKQPAFDHPLLKDHVVQMKPSLLPKLVNETSSSRANGPRSSMGLDQHVQCLEGTVPIRRTTKEDLIRIKSLSKSTNYSNIVDQSPNNKYTDHHGAAITLKDKQIIYGAKAIINVYNPPVDNVDQDQFSAAEIWLLNGQPQDHNSLEAGWMVFPRLFNDNLTRIFGYWTMDNYQKTGCYNTLCPGFVQVHKSIYIGGPVYATSTYRAPQQAEIELFIFQDQETGNWWLKIDDKLVGYWPKSIFTYLGTGGQSVYWGGHVKEGPNGLSPQMGNGHLPKDYACYFRQVQYVNVENKLIDLRGSKLERIVNCENLYDLIDYGYIPHSIYGNTFFFGGPAGRCSS